MSGTKEGQHKGSMKADKGDTHSTDRQNLTIGANRKRHRALRNPIARARVGVAKTLTQRGPINDPGRVVLPNAGERLNVIWPPGP